MLILILINIIIIIWIYLKYYNSQTNKNITNQEITKMDSIIIGSINDKKTNNNFDLILSAIIDMNIKGYLKIEYDENDINSQNYIIKPNFSVNLNTIKEHEIIMLNFLFPKNIEITKSELEEKLLNTFNSYNVQYNDLQKVIKNELLKDNIIDKQKDEELQQVFKIYKIESFIFIIILLIIKIFIFNKISSLSILFYILEKIIEYVLIAKASNYTFKGENLKNSINLYKEKIQNKEFLIDKKTMKEIVLEKEFADSIALHINTQAKRIFIDDKITQNATKSVKKVFVKIIIILSIYFLVGFALQNLTKTLTKDGIIWLYILMTILVALSADITKMLGTPKK